MRQLTSSAALWRKSRWTFSVSRNLSDIWTRFSLYCSLTPCTPCYWNISDLQINLILYSRECVIKVSGNLTGSPCQADQWLMADGHRRPVSRSLLQSYIYVPQDTATSTDSIGGNQTRLKHAHSASRICFHTYFTSPLSMLSILICHKIFAVFWMHCNGGFVFCVLKHADHSQWITSQLLFCQPMLCLMLSFMYNKQLHGTKNGPNFLSIVSFVVPEMMHTKC